MGLDPSSKGTGRATNVATDILRYYTQYLDGTLVGQGSKAMGLPKQTLENQLRQVLKTALELYFRQYPAYNVNGVIDFFRDPVTAQQLGNYLFDHRPIDQQVIESALLRHLQQDAVSRHILQQRGGSIERIVPDFLACYRQALTELTDPSELPLLLTVLDAPDRVIGELRASEAHLQKLVTEALQAARATNPVLPSERVVEAIEAFIEAQTWEESKRIVEAQQDVLLTDTAEQVLNNMLEQNRDDERAKQILREHLDLLKRCRSDGIESAFADYLLLKDIQALLDESETLTSPNDIAQKVKIYQQIFERINRSAHPQLWAHIQANLATSLLGSRLIEQDDNLEASINAYQQAIQTIPPDSPTRPALLINLGIGLHDRYNHTGNLADLEAAINAYQEAVQTSPSNFPNWHILLIKLGNGLRDRYARTWELADLEAAITTYQQAIQVAPSNSPDRSGYLINLGNGLHDRYKRTGNLADLETAINAYQEAVQTSPSNSSDQLTWLIDLGNGLHDRYKRTGNLADLEAAISVYQQAIQMAPSNFPNRHILLNNLGSGMLELYNRSGYIVNLERAITLFQQAIDQTPVQSSQLPSYLSNLSNAYLDLYNRTGNLADLEPAIQLTQQIRVLAQNEGNLQEEGYSLQQLGTLARLQGHYSEAQQLFEQSMFIARHVGDMSSNALSLYNLGMVAQEQGDYPQARQLFEQSLASFEGIGDLSKASALQHQLGRLDFLTQQRYVNVAIIRQEDRMIVPKATNLRTRRTYDLRLDIGPLRDDSIVVNAEQYPFPVNRLPQTEIGYWLEVIVVSDDFTIPAHQHTLFLPKYGPSWVCECPMGEDHRCSENERQPYLYIPIEAPEQPGVARLRIAIYYQRNLIQSQLLTARVAETEQKGAGHSSIIDYTLASDLRDLSFLPPRTLHILTNDNVDGSHRIIINGEGDDVLAFNLTEGQIRVTVDAAREVLRNIHYEEYGGTLGSQRQRRNLLDSNNAKAKDAFIQDLARLAPLGWKLWTLLLKDRLEWRKKLLAPATIQISRTISSTLAFPWALVYDIPLDSHGQYDVCPLIKNWDEKKVLVDSSAYSCPHQSTHSLKNVLCPFGFWGFRHAIEQPPSMPRGRNLPVVIQMTNQPPELVIGFSQRLGKEQTTKHLQTLKKELALFTLQDCSSLKDIIAALAVPVEVVYFYCHGGREPLAGTSQYTPYLQIGEDEQFQPSDITIWRVADWPEDHWEQTSPLVFINGCHTAELTPELLVNFVDAFSTAYASGVIGTEIAVEQHIAAEAAERFFDAFQQNKTVGQALQQMRLHFLAKGNLLGLAYTPYCSVSLHL